MTKERVSELEDAVINFFPSKQQKETRTAMEGEQASGWLEGGRKECNAGKRK
jgi:hypothetical protein